MQLPQEGWQQEPEQMGSQPPQQRSRSFWRLFGRQSSALLHKSLLIRARSWRLNLAHILQSVVIIFIIWLVEQAMNLSASQFTGASAARTVSPTRVSPLPDCASDIYLKSGDQCWVFLYTPAGDPVVERLVDGVLAGNDPPLPRSAVLGMKSRKEADTWLVANPQRVLAALHFRELQGGGAGPAGVKSLAYILQINDTVSYFRGSFRDINSYMQLPLQAAVESAYTRLMLDDPSLPFSLSTADFTHPSLATSSPAGRVAPVFLLASLMFNVVLLLQSVVGERETGVRGAMTAMGLLDSAYWASVVIPEILLSLLHAALLTGLAAAFGFSMVRHNAPALLFLLLALSCLALSALAMAVSALVRKTELAVPVALVLFIIAWIFMLVISFGVPFDGSSSVGLQAVFAAFPWSLLAKGLADLSDATAGTARGISWEQRNSYCWAHTPPPAVQAELAYWKSGCSLPLGTAFLALLAQAGGYLVIALFLDGVLPQEPGGTSRPWYFPVLPSFWWPRSEEWDPKYARTALEAVQKQKNGAGEMVGGGAGDEDGDDDVDVQEEADRVQQLCRQALGEGPDVVIPQTGPMLMPAAGMGLTGTAASAAADGLGERPHQGAARPPTPAADAPQPPPRPPQPPQPPQPPPPPLPHPAAASPVAGEITAAESSQPSRSMSGPMPLLAATSQGGHSNGLQSTSIAEHGFGAPAAPASTTTLNSSGPRGLQSFTSIMHSGSPMHSTHSVGHSMHSSSAGSMRVHAPASHAVDLSVGDDAASYSEAVLRTGATAVTDVAAAGEGIVSIHGDAAGRPLQLVASKLGLGRGHAWPWGCFKRGAFRATEAGQGSGTQTGSMHAGGTGVAAPETAPGFDGHPAATSSQPAPVPSHAVDHSHGWLHHPGPFGGHSRSQQGVAEAASAATAQLMSGVHLLGLRKVFQRGRRGHQKPRLHTEAPHPPPRSNASTTSIDSSRAASSSGHHNTPDNENIISHDTIIGSSGSGHEGAVATGRDEASWAAKWVRWCKSWLLPGQLVAVEGTWLGLEPGACFCLLGPNGAGKTTTIKCLTGAVSPTGGDAVVWGASVRASGGLARVRAVTGVCPQFDVLWPEMTGREHMALFCSIKDIPRAEADAQIESLLHEVSLTKAASTYAGNYSGGMRRRLSLAIALLGSPKLLVLDEPTTGLDPVSRRAVWALLSKAKVGRCMLLTTHSMEEADVLGDRIGIFAAGRLMCLGNSLHLKARFGDGLRVAVGLRPDSVLTSIAAGTDDMRAAGSTSLDAPPTAVLEEAMGTSSSVGSFGGAGVGPMGGVAGKGGGKDGTLDLDRAGSSKAGAVATVGMDDARGGKGAARAASGAPTDLPLAVRVRILKETVRQELERYSSGSSQTKQQHRPQPHGPPANCSSAQGFGPEQQPGGVQQVQQGAAGMVGGEVSVAIVGPAGTEAPLAVMPAAAAAGTGPSLHFERFVVPHTAEAALPHLFDVLQSMEGTLGVKDIQVGLTTLEEVFLSVTRQQQAAASSS